MRHLTLEELLQLDDGETLPALAEHLVSCAPCAAALNQLRTRRARLRALPHPPPPSDGWQTLQRSILRARRNRRAATVGLALAASIAALVLIPSIARRQPVSHTAPPSAPSGAPELDALISQSMALENRLNRLPEPKAAIVADADSRVQLEDQLAFIDQCIGSLRREAAPSAELSSLWKARIELQQALIEERTPSLALAL